MTDRFYCLPSTEEGRAFRTRLRGSDATFMVLMDVPVALVWKDRQIDPDVLRKSLIRALDLFPIVAARLVRDKGDQAFTVEGSQGVLLEVCKSKRKMPSASARSREWNRFFTPFINHKVREPFRRALMASRLTLFEGGGCALCSNFAHCLTDGASILAFIKAWSHFCGVEAGQTEFFPQEAPPKPVLERPIPIEQVPMDKAHVKAYHKERDWLFGWLVDGGHLIMRNFAVDTVADFRLSAEDLASLKKSMCDELEAPKWISSYEAIMAALLRVLATADGRKEMPCRAIVNIRGRSSLAPKEYFGNALTFHSMNIKNSGPLSETAFAFHESLRAALEDEEGLNRPHFAGEYLRSKGQLRHFWHRLRMVKPFFHTLRTSERCPIANSWVGFDWFGVDFGLGGHRPDFLRVATTFRHCRHVHLYPSSREGEMMVRLQLAPSTMARFRLALKEHKLDSIIQEVK